MMLDKFQSSFCTHCCQKYFCLAEKFEIVKFIRFQKHFHFNSFPFRITKFSVQFQLGIVLYFFEEEGKYVSIGPYFRNLEFAALGALS